MIFVIAVLVFIVLAVIVRQHESNMQNKVNRQILRDRKAVARRQKVLRKQARK